MPLRSFESKLVAKKKKEKKKLETEANLIQKNRKFKILIEINFFPVKFL